MARVNIGVYHGETVYRMVQITGLHESRRVRDAAGSNHFIHLPVVGPVRSTFLVCCPTTPVLSLLNAGLRLWQHTRKARTHHTAWQVQAAIPLQLRVQLSL
jgi:hypothetical protein